MGAIVCYFKLTLSCELEDTGGTWDIIPVPTPASPHLHPSLLTSPDTSAHVKVDGPSISPPCCVKDAVLRKQAPWACLERV